MTILRTLAIIVALGGVLDPSFQASRKAPVPVRLLVPAADPRADAVAASIRAALAERVEFIDAGASAATVAVGGIPPESIVSGGGSVSIVALEPSASAAIVETPPSVDLTPGTAMDIPVTLEAVGLSGQSTTLVLEQEGVELARVTQTWKADGPATVKVPYVAASAGARRLTLRLETTPGERRPDDPRVDVLARVAPRPARVAVIEPRPSWAGGFARRMLENDPAFQVSSLVRTSRGIVSRAGEALPMVRAEHLERFDVLVIGSPEDLPGTEVEAVWQFAARRGGTVVLLPDRPPSGSYAARLPATFAEQLLTEPRPLEPSGMLASELATMTTLPPGGRTLAAIDKHPVVVSWPVGDGRVLFSGALDAWRYRAHEQSRLTPFWQEEILTAAMAAPPAVRLEVSPAVLRPGDLARVRVRLRRTEWVESPEGKGAVQLPAVAARLTDPAGRTEMVRLWPDSETGTFYGQAAVAVAGVHTVRVETDRQATAEAVVVADAGASYPRPSRELTSDLPALTGGTTVSASDLAPLVRHLTTLPHQVQAIPVHPFRAAWWPWVFAGLLCGEWALRRRAGWR